MADYFQKIKMKCLKPKKQRLLLNILGEIQESLIKMLSTVTLTQMMIVKIGFDALIWP